MRKIFFLVLIGAALAAGWLAWAVYAPVTPVGQTFVMLHSGYSTRRIAAELKKHGVIHSQDAFLLWHYLHRQKSLKAGEYLFENPAALSEVHDQLARGEVYFHTVVVPEGFTMFDIARAVEAAGLGTSEDFVKVAQTDTGLIADLSPGAKSLEGYLFPETYQFSRTMTLPEMAAAMVKQFRQVARQIGLIAASGEAAASAGPKLDVNTTPIPEETARLIPTPDQKIARIVTMASIVEKETAVPEERPMVASVYYNRLAKRIALDADPSVIYAEELAGTYTGALHHNDMQFASPYNTYRNPGLPPGPIANPGKSALEAAMHPAKSDFFYFVADAAGHHRFARTIEEHNQNVAAYRKAMRDAHH